MLCGSFLFCCVRQLCLFVWTRSYACRKVTIGIFEFCGVHIHHTNILFHEDCPGIFEFFFSGEKFPKLRTLLIVTRIVIETENLRENEVRPFFSPPEKGNPHKIHYRSDFFFHSTGLSQLSYNTFEFDPKIPPSLAD